MERLVRRRFAILLLALGLDLAFGELPNRLHPVAWLGGVIAAGRRFAPRATKGRELVSGVAMAVALPAGAGVAALAVRRLAAQAGSFPALVVEVVVLKQCFAVRSLFEHSRAVRTALAAGELEAARAAASKIVGRETSGLDEAGVASAAIESLAENLSDSVVGPLLWYGAGGLFAAVVYRVVNTLDAMVGYRHEGWFGMPSARLDDAFNLVPARLTALGFAFGGGRTVATLRGVWRDARRTPSPNSGWPMAAAAHQLDVRLEKRGYHVLNEGARAAGAEDIEKCERLAGRAAFLSGIGAAGGLALAARALR